MIGGSHLRATALSRSQTTFYRRRLPWYEATDEICLPASGLSGTDIVYRLMNR